MNRFARHARAASLSAGAIATLAVATAPSFAQRIRHAVPRPAPAAGGSVATIRDDGVILISLGETKTINLNLPMSDVIIADPAVVDVTIRSTRQLYLIPKAAGQSEITITNDAGRPIYRAIVRVGNNLTSVDQMLKLAMPDADITVTTMNGTILLTGTVAAPEDAQEAEALVTAFTKGTVLSRLRTATPLTVNLQVRIAEVNKSLTKNIGFNFATVDQTGGFKFGMGSGRGVPNPSWAPGGALGVGTGLTPPAGGTAIGALTSGSTLGADTRLFGLNILAALDLAENQGLASTLANPNLTALSGETASFLAGGEIPIPMASSLGQTSVEYKQYGVSLSFTPTVLADGRISMRVRPEVSQLDDSAGVKINGFSLPAISTRRAETTVELGSGQSFMIGGLLSTTNSNSISKTPFLGDIPILGNLFKSTGFRRQETELVIIVTPYLVQPVNARDIHLPTDGFRNANDAQRYLGARLHDGSAGEPRPVPQMAPPVTVPPPGTPAPAPAGGASGGSADAAPPPRRPARANAAPGFSF